MSKLAIIDGDFICYKVCPNSKKQEEPKTLQQTLDLVDWYIEEKIIYPTNIDEYIAYLGGIGNFRYSLTNSYKSNRPTKRPPFFREVKEYLVGRWNFNIVDGIEAEDAVGITLTKYPDALLIYEDHDLHQLPGFRYNPTKGVFGEISREEANYFLMCQLLQGCSTDKVRGLKKGLGEKTAIKLLDGLPDEALLFEVFDLYMLEYGEHCGINEFHTQYNLLKVLRDKLDFIIPKPTKVPKKPDLITNQF